MAAPVVHFEINTNGDARKLWGFYEHVFGWKVQAMQGDQVYGTVTGEHGHGIGGGIGQAQGTPSVTFYIEVTDPAATLKQIEAAGGKTVVPVTEIPGVVTFANFRDPDGNLIGLVKAEPT